MPRLCPFRPRGGFRRGGHGRRREAPTTGRRDEIPPEAEKGTAWAPGGFNFFFLPSMNTTKVAIFSANIFVNTTKN